MKSFDTELQRFAQKVRLKATERRMLRERILSYMEYHPLPKQRGIAREHFESQSFVTIHFNSLYTRLAGAAFLVLVLIGVPVAAERSVPGDALYLVKTGINESIQAQFANSPYERVAFETRLVERRIAEARLLASEGKLTEEVEAKIAETVKNHTNAAQIGLAELRANDIDEAAIAEIAYGSALDIQSAVLSGETDVSASSTDGIKDALMIARANALEQRGTGIPSYDRLIARIEMETTRAAELYETIEESATGEEQRAITRRFDDINRNIAKAQQVGEAEEGAAIPELAKSLGLIQKLIAFMTDIDVREHVSLDELIPIELTDEERAEIVHTLLAEVIMTQASIEAKIPAIDDEGLAEKVILGNAEVKREILAVTGALEEGDVDGAEGALADAYALVLDLDKLTENVEKPDGEESATTTPEFGEIVDDGMDEDTATSSTSTEDVGGIDLVPATSETEEEAEATTTTTTDTIELE
jgi:hypothetical protein